MRLLHVIVGAAVAALLWVALDAQADTTVPGGQLPASTTWTPAGSPYHVTGSLTVLHGRTLTIQPGVEVIFDAGVLAVGGYDSGWRSGTLLASGTAEQPITFRFTPSGGFDFNFGNGASVLRHVQVTGDMYFGGNAQGITVDTLRIEGAAAHAIRSDGPSLTLKNVTLADNAQGVQASGGLTVTNLALQGPNAGLTVSGPLTLTNADITGPTAVLTVGGDVTLTDVAVSGGVAALDGGANSRLVLTDVTLTGNTTRLRGGFDQSFSNVLVNGIAPSEVVVSGGWMTTSRNVPNRMPTRVVGSVTVFHSATLTLQPGAQVTFDAGVLAVGGYDSGWRSGTLLASGTAEQPITFRFTPSGGFDFNFGNGASVLRHVQVTGDMYFGGNSQGVTIDGLRIEGAAAHAIRSDGPSLTLKNVTLANNAQGVQASNGLTATNLVLQGPNAGLTVNGHLTLTNADITGPTAVLTVGGDVTLTEVTVSGGVAAIDGGANSRLVLTDVTVTGNTTRLRGGFDQSFSNVLVNGVAPSEVVVSSGWMTTSRNVPNRMPTRVVGSVTVFHGATLTLQPGALVTFDSGVLAVGGYDSGWRSGTLLASGTAEQPITFRFTPSGGFDFNFGNGASVFRNVLVTGDMYFGGNSQGVTIDGLRIEGAAAHAIRSDGPSLTLKNVTLANNAQGVQASNGLTATNLVVQGPNAGLTVNGHLTLTNAEVTGPTAVLTVGGDLTLTDVVVEGGVAAIDGGANSRLVLVEVTVTGNTTRLRGGFDQSFSNVLVNGVAPSEVVVSSGWMTTSRNVPNRMPTRVVGSVTVFHGATLTLQPGAQVTFDSGVLAVGGYDSGWRSGTLVATGTAAQPITFRFTPSGGFDFNFGNGASVFRNVLVTGDMYFGGNAQGITVDALRIEGAAAHAIRSDGPSLTLKNVTLADNAQGVQASGGLTATNLVVQGPNAGLTVNGHLTLTNADITGPTAVLTVGGDVTLTDVVLDGAVAAIDGGANSRLVLDDVELTGTTTRLRGGFDQSFTDVRVNGQAPTEVVVSSGWVTTSRNVPTRMPTRVVGSVTVFHGATLTLQPGAQVTFDSGVLAVGGYDSGWRSGTLLASGTAAQPITFRFTPSGGFDFNFGNGASVFRNVLVTGDMYFGGNSQGVTVDGLRIEGAAAHAIRSDGPGLTMKGLTLANNAQGIQSSAALAFTDLVVQGPNAVIATGSDITLTNALLQGTVAAIDSSTNARLALTDVTLAGNTTRIRGGFDQAFANVLVNGAAPTEIVVPSGWVTSSRTVPARLPVRALGSLTILHGATLTLQPGAELTFDSGSLVVGGYDSGWRVGTLVAAGTAEQPITLRSSGTWSGLNYQFMSAMSLRHVTIEDATTAITHARTGVTLTLDNVTIGYSGTRGIDLSAAARIDAKNLHIHDSVQAIRCRSDGILHVTGGQLSSYQQGISLDDCGTSTLAGVSFVGNGTYALQVTNSGTVNAELNYWGHPDGPSTVTAPNRGDQVFGPVDFDPWLAAPGPAVQLPDLWLQGHEVTMSSPFIGGRNATMGLVVRNPTRESTAPSLLSVSQDGAWLGNVSIPAIPPFDSVALSLTFQPPVSITDSGRFHLYEVRLDPSSDLAERNEANNVVTRTFVTEEVIAPNPVLHDGLELTFLPPATAPFPGQLAELRGTVSYTFIHPPEPASGIDVTVVAEGIARTVKTDGIGGFAVPHYFSAAGAFVLNVTMTDGTFIDWADVPFTVQPVYPEGVDLALTSLRLGGNAADGTVFGGDEASVHVTVANLGANATTGPFDVEVFIDDQFLTGFTLGPLAGFGASEELSHGFTVSESLVTESHRIWARVDGGNGAPGGGEVAEVREDNNEICGFRQTGCRDLDVVNFGGGGWGGGFDFDLGGGGSWGNWQPGFHVETPRQNLGASASVSAVQALFGQPITFTTGVHAGALGYDGTFQAQTTLDGVTTTTGGGPLGSSASVTAFSSTRSYSAPGTHTVSIGVSGSVRESSTRDNSASASVTVFPDKPWLSVSGCVVVGNAHWSGDDIVIKMTLSNAGGVGAATPYQIWYDSVLIGSGVASVPGFHGMATITSAPQEVTGGTHTIRCVADPQRTIDQYIVDPAALERSFTWTVTPRPDLTVRKTSFEGPFVEALTSTLEFRVDNLGDAASPATAVCVTGLGQPQQVTIPALEPGQSHSGSATGAFLSAAPLHTVTLVVDCAQAIAERNEANNVDQFTVLVLSLLPDLTVDIEDVIESDIHPGIAQFEPVSVVMRVDNIGFAPSPASARLRLQTEIPGPQGTAIVQVCEVGIPALARGQDWEARCTARLPAGQQVLRAKVLDVGLQLSTFNDDDTWSASVQAPSVEILASGLRFHPIQDPGAAFAVNATVRNVGAIIAYQLGIGLHVDDTRFGPTPALATIPVGDLWPGDVATGTGSLSEPDEGLHIVKAKPSVKVAESGAWYATRGLLVGDPTGLPLVATPWLMEGGQSLNDYLADTLPAYQPGEAVGYWRLYAVLADEDGVEHRVPYNGAKVLVATSDPALPVQEAFSVQLFGRDGVLRAPLDVAAGPFSAHLTDTVTVGGLPAPALRFDDLGLGGSAFWLNATIDGRAGSFRQTFDGERAAFVFGSVSFELFDAIGGSVGVGVGSERAWHHRFDAVTEDGGLARGVALQRTSHGAQLAGEAGVSIGLPGVSIGTTVRTTETAGVEAGSQSLIPDATTAEGLTLMELMATKGLIEAILEHPNGGWRDDWELEQLLLRVELEILARPGGIEVVGAEWGSYVKEEREVEASVTLPIDFDIEVNSVQGTSLTGFSTTKLTVSDRLAAGLSESVRISERKGFTMDPLTGEKAAYVETQTTSEQGGKWQALFWEGDMAGPFGPRVSTITTRLEWAPGSTGAPTWWVQTVGYENVTRHDIAALGHDDLIGGGINPLVALTSIPVDWAAWGDVLTDVQVTLRVPVCGPGVATDCMPASFAGLDLALNTPFEPLKLVLALDEVLVDGGIPVSYSVEAGRPTYRLVNDRTISVAVGFDIPILGLGASGEVEHRSLNHYLEQTRAVLATGVFLGQAPVQAAGSGSLPEVPTMESLVWNGFQHKRVLLTLASPADLLVTDPEGRRIGYLDGGFVNEIPGASSFRPLGGEHEQYLLPHGPAYTIQVIGTGEGDYHLTMAGLGAGDNEITYLETATINGTTDVVVYDSATGNASITPEVPRPGLFRLMDRDGDLSANATGSTLLGGAPPRLRALAASPDQDADAWTGDAFHAGFAYEAGDAGPAHVVFRFPAPGNGTEPQLRQLVDGRWARSAAPVDWANRSASLDLGASATYAVFLDSGDTVPAAPGGLSATSGVRKVTLAWDEPDSHGAPVASYAVLRDGEPFAEVLAPARTLVDGDVADGEAHAYQVLAVNDEGAGPASAEVTGRAFDVPSTPLEVVATPGPGRGDISLAWRLPASDGGTPVLSYTVLGGDAGQPMEVLGTTQGATSFTDSDLANGQHRAYAVAAANAAGDGPPSEPAAARTFALPSAPAGLAASPGPGANEATLAWPAPADDGGSPVTGYVLHRVGKGTSVALPAALEPFTDGGLADGETASYAIAAVTIAGEGPASGAVAVTAFDVPGAPTGLTATGGVRQVELSWTAPGGDGGTPVTGYTVYRTPAGGPTVVAADLGAVTSYTDTGLANGLPYTYTVAAVNLAGEGPASASAGASTFALPSAPRTITFTPGVNQLDVRWVKPAVEGGTPVTEYVVQSGPSSSSWAEETKTPTARLLDTDVPAGRYWYYRIAAVNAAGQGPFTNVVSSRSYEDLLDAPTVVVPPSGEVARLSVCESGTLGCQPALPGRLCVQVSIAGGLPNPLACAVRSSIPAEVYPTLRDLPDAAVVVPDAGTGAVARTPHVQVWYDYVGAYLTPNGAVCLPVGSEAEATGLQARPTQSELLLRVVSAPGTVPQVSEVRTLDYAGQIVAAAQATLGVIPCS